MILGLLLSCAYLTHNDVTTGETPQYPDLAPLYVRVAPPAAFARARVVAETMHGWSDCFVDNTLELPVLRCEAHSRFFTDDVWIWAESHGRGVTRVMTRSKSRVGKGDFGANARRIEAFQGAYQAYTP